MVILSFVAWKTPESAVWLARRQEMRAEGISAPKFSLPPGAVRNVLLAFCFVFFLQYVFWGVFNWTPTYLASVKHFNFLHSLPFVLALHLGALSGFLLFGSLVDRLGRKPMFAGLYSDLDLRCFLLRLWPVFYFAGRHLLQRLLRQWHFRRHGSVPGRAGARYPHARFPDGVNL